MLFWSIGLVSLAGVYCLVAHHRGWWPFLESEDLAKPKQEKEKKPEPSRAAPSTKPWSRIGKIVGWAIGVTIIVVLVQMHESSETRSEAEQAGRARLAAAEERKNDLLAVERGVEHLSVGKTYILATSEGAVYESPGCDWRWSARPSPDINAQFIVGWWDRDGYHELLLNKDTKASDVSIACDSPRYIFRSTTEKPVRLTAIMASR